MKTIYERFKTEWRFREKMMKFLSDEGIVAHGSLNVFDSFDTDKMKRAKEGWGLYFSNEAYKAEEYALVGEYVFVDTKDLNIAEMDEPFSIFTDIVPKNISDNMVLLGEKQNSVVRASEYNAIQNEIDEMKRTLSSVFDNVDFENYKKCENGNFGMFGRNATIRNLLSYAYNNFTGNGMKDMAQILSNLKIDGYRNGNIFILVNVEKVNRNIIKDKEKLLRNVLEKYGKEID